MRTAKKKVKAAINPRTIEGFLKTRPPDYWTLTNLSDRFWLAEPFSTKEEAESQRDKIYGYMVARGDKFYIEAHYE